MKNHSKINNTFAALFRSLDLLEMFIYNSDSCEEKAGELIMLAYIFRIGVLDKIEENPLLLRQKFIVLIVKSLFKIKKYQLQDAIERVVSKFESLTSYNREIFNSVNAIMERNEYFDNYEKTLTFDTKHEIFNTYK